VVAVRPTEIASPTNPRIRAAALLRDRRERDRSGRILVDGARELLRALNAGVTIETIFGCEALCRSNDCRALLRRLTADDPRLVPVSEAAFARVAFGDRAEGVVGVAVRPSIDLAALRVPPDPLIAVVEGIEKPGNLGAILRSADGAGVDALIAADPRTDLFNPTRSGPASGRSSGSRSRRRPRLRRWPGCASVGCASWSPAWRARRSTPRRTCAGHWRSCSAARRRASPTAGPAPA
jgi:tRNA G18 (ribose-2'-O)-methylase SpoU